MDATIGLLAYAKNGFPLKRRHNDITRGHDLPQTMRLGLPDPVMPSLTLWLNPFRGNG